LGKKVASLTMPHIVAGRRARKETNRLCSDNEAGGRDGKAEIKLKKNMRKVTN
jgi:hypothetical protein